MSTFKRDPDNTKRGSKSELKSSSKRIPNPIIEILSQGSTERWRSIFVMVGENWRSRLIELYQLMFSQRSTRQNKILWCYEKELGFDTHFILRKRKLTKALKNMAKKNTEIDQDSSFKLTFDTFISSANIRWCYHKDTKDVLGSTFQILILQDPLSLHPNTLARTIETVEGGGLIIIPLKKLSEVSAFHSVLAKSKNSSQLPSKLPTLFQTRFIKSLTKCSQFIMFDHGYNVLYTNKYSTSNNLNTNSLLGLPKSQFNDPQRDQLVDSVSDLSVISSLAPLAKTFDQCKVLISVMKAISQKSKSTNVIIAPRGRGKSASLGISIASAVSYGYSQIFVTSPTPENLTTLFEFVLLGLNALGLKEHADYRITYTTAKELEKISSQAQLSMLATGFEETVKTVTTSATNDSQPKNTTSFITRIDIFYEKVRQTIQYILPTEHAKLSSCEMLIVDEAAAIPLPVVKKLFGNYLLLFSSTVHGYEGTGRSLSLKLISSLKSRTDAAADVDSDPLFSSISMKTPIRYSLGDPVESWLNSLLCLDVQPDITTDITTTSEGYPFPSECSLYLVNKEKLFSGKKASEAFLSQVWNVLVASHYKNSPNDLEILSDDPFHYLFILVGPITDSSKIPPILTVVQICLEGKIDQSSVQTVTTRSTSGISSSGNLVPWTIVRHFQDVSFSSLFSARVVRIAVHPLYQSKGYGTRAIDLLSSYLSGEFVSAGSGHDQLNNSSIISTSHNKQLLIPLNESFPPQIHYLSTSFGLTRRLFSFWSSCHISAGATDSGDSTGATNSTFHPLYIRQTPNSLTGEFSTILVCPLTSSVVPPESRLNPEWILSFAQDWKRRFLRHLSGPFKHLDPSLCVDLLNPRFMSNTFSLSSLSSLKNITKNDDNFIDSATLSREFSPFDMKRFESYSRQLNPLTTILDLIYLISQWYFSNQIPIVSTTSQAIILCSIGLQKNQLIFCSKLLKKPIHQINSQLFHLLTRIWKYFYSLQAAEIEQEEEEEVGSGEVPVPGLGVPLKTLDEELDDAVDAGWQDALEEISGGSIPTSISVRRVKKPTKTSLLMPVDSASKEPPKKRKKFTRSMRSKRNR